jgi:hypothetical protein
VKALHLFQNVNGSWHWPSIVLVAGWLAGSAVTGCFVFANLFVNRTDRERIGPWTLTDRQVAAFVDNLRVQPSGRVAIEYTASDQLRSQAFASRIKEMMREAGYDVWDYSPAFQQTGNAPPMVGIEISTRPQTQTVGQRIERAFASMGVNSRLTSIMNNNYEDSYVVIYVGIKPN